MHAAPPVRVSLGRSVAWSALQGLAWAAAAANFLAWALLTAQQPEAVAATAALAAGLAVAVVSATASWQRQEPGVLSWDGQAWHWRGQPCVVRIAIDWNSRLLLSVRSDRHRWVVAEQAHVGPDWHALRAAGFAPTEHNAAPAPAG